MNKKLILIGIVLLSILWACSDRNEEINPQAKKEQFKVSSKAETDSLETHNRNDENNSYDIVDPTKPDKPW